MKKYILAIGAVVVAAVLLSGCAGVDLPDWIPGQSWTWELSASGDGWNTISFTQSQIDTCASDSPLDVLESIDSYWDFVFEDGTWKNYWYNQDNPSMNGGTLQHIQPDIDYLIHVTQDCTLTIG